MMTTPNLLDLCDRLSIARHFVHGLYLAGQASSTGDDRAALCALADAAREMLKDVETSLQQIVRGELDPEIAGR